MWWSDRARRSGARPGRRAVLALGLSALAACGFTPVYAPGGPGEALWGEIAVDPPADAEGYAFMRRMEERLGRPETPRYRLSAEIALRQEGLAVTPDQETTRYQLLGRLTYRLADAATGAVVTQGKVENFTAYSAPVFTSARGSIAGNTVSVLAAERDAKRRLMTSLADQTVSRLLASAPEWHK